MARIKIHTFVGKIRYFIHTLSGCWICCSHKPKPDGYFMVWYRGRYIMAHRLSYILAHGNIPDGAIIRHTCDNPKCINPAHLLSGTHYDNIRDRVDRNRSAVGSKHGRSRLTEEIVREIRKSHLSTYSLAEIYGVDHKAIHRAKKGETWKHVA